MGSGAALLAAALAALAGGSARRRRRRRQRQALAIAPAAPHALGRVLTAGPGRRVRRCSRRAATATRDRCWGWTTRTTGSPARLTLDERPLPWLDLALRLDGRYDAHLFPGQPTDTGMVGDPRLYVRVDRAWPGGLRLGARAGLWLPGRDAPSLQASALSPEILGIASYVPRSTAIALTANVGYRIDRSAHSAPDAAQLGPGNRLALEVSAFNEVLVGRRRLGRGPAKVRRGQRRPARRLRGAAHLVVAHLAGRRRAVRAGTECAPRSGGGGEPQRPARHRPDRAAGADPAALFSLARPGVPVRRRASAAPRSPCHSPRHPGGGAPPRPEDGARSGAGRRLRRRQAGRPSVRGHRGGSSREVPSTTSGRFAVEGKPGDELTVAAEATGYLPGRATVILTPGANKLDLTLERRPPQGQIRGLVRSLRGAPVAADISIDRRRTTRARLGRRAEPAPPRRERSVRGRRSPRPLPGDHLGVRLSDAATKGRRRGNGVTVLNVDLRSQR